MKKIVAITGGDPGGIGPEIVRAALASPHLPTSVEFRIISTSRAKTPPGKATLPGARAAWQDLDTAIAGCLHGDYAGIVTGPVCKESLVKAGFPDHGQTEYLARSAKIPPNSVTMAMVGLKWSLFLLTTHLPLRRAVRAVTARTLTRTTTHAAEFLARRGISPDRIAVAGLNPHAGENGLLGREELDTIQPALTQLRKKWKLGRHSLPLLPPDTVYLQAQRGHYDCVISLYHDQGLIPFKLISFDTGVNLTWGLPFIRTSPDHGTAFDIAGQGIADPGSMIHALRLAAELVTPS